MSDDTRDAIIAQIEEKYAALLRKLADGILHDWQEAEDAVQTVLLEVICKHGDVLDLDEKEYRNYICTAVENTAINIYNKRKKTEPMDPNEMNEKTINRVDMDAFRDAYGFGEEMQELISQLDDIDKDIIKLKYGCGYTTAEIAPAIGKSEAAVRKRSERAIRKIQAILLDKEVERDDR